MKVFISHSQKDLKLAEELSSQLSTAGVDVWLAAKEVLPGDNWSLEVGRALQRANAMVVLLSPAAAESANVQHEVAYALASPDFEGRVLPVVVKPTGKIPWFLRKLRMYHLEGTNGKSVRRMAEKLVEAMLGAARSESVARGIIGRRGVLTNEEA